jgi:hypothetical protein
VPHFCDTRVRAPLQPRGRNVCDLLEKITSKMKHGRKRSEIKHYEEDEKSTLKGSDDGICIILSNTGFLDFVLNPKFQTELSVSEIGSFSSSGKMVRKHLFNWVYYELISITSSIFTSF